MPSVSLTGRTKSAASKSKHHPSVRVRQRRYQEKNTPAVKGSVKKRRASRSGSDVLSWLSSFTFAGLAMATTLTTLFLLLMWVFVFGTTFLVKEINISGSTSLSQAQITEAFYQLQDSRKAFFVPGNHLALINSEDVSRVLNQKYPHVAGVTNFDRQWPDKVSFLIVDKEPVFKLTGKDGKMFLVDREGVVLKEGVDASGVLVAIEVALEHNPKPGDMLGSVPVLSFALDINNSWPPNLPFKPRAYQVVAGPASGEFNIFTDQSWYIKADADDSADNLLGNLMVIYESELQPQNIMDQLAYIDLRLSSRAFYCLKGQPCAN